MMEFIGLIFIGACIVLGAMIISFALEPKEEKEEGEKKSVSSFKLPFQDKEMAQIIRKSTPVDDFLKKRDEPKA